MRFEQFKKEVEANVRGRIRPEDIIRYETERDQILISVIPYEYGDSMYPSISLTDIYETFKRENVSIDEVGAHVVEMMIKLWSYIDDNREELEETECPHCGGTKGGYLS